MNEDELESANEKILEKDSKYSAYETKPMGPVVEL
jgi:hypothetical protein